MTRRTRAASLGAVAVLHGGLFYALLHGLGEQVMPQAAGPAVIAYDVPPPSPSPTPPLPPPPPPPPPSPEPQVRRSEPAKAPAPPAPKATPRAGTVPEPRLILVPEAPPVPRATGSGSDAGAGAAESGSGSGAGGVGSGGGAGGPGGEGAGAGVLARRAEKIAGELKARDFPRSGAADRNGRAIVVRYQVGADGRVRQCRVTQSSGNAEVDAITCRLIEQRFRYRPALDRLGRPMADETGWKQWWWQ